MFDAAVRSSDAAGRVGPIQTPVSLAQRAAPGADALPLADAPVDYDQVFGRSAPRSLEIGFGMGHSLLEMAAAAPEQDFIGVEVHRPGVGALLHHRQAPAGRPWGPR